MNKQKNNCNIRLHTEAFERQILLSISTVSKFLLTLFYAIC